MGCFISICGQSIPPPNEKAAKFVLAIKILTFLQLIISVLDIASIYFIRQGVLGLLMCILLFSGFYKLSHVSLMSFCFIAIFFSFTFLIYLMTQAQRGTDIIHQKHADQYTFSIAIVTTVYYIFTSAFIFYPYRQFKFIEYSKNPGFQQFMGATQAMTQQQPSDPYSIDYAQNIQENQQQMKNKKQQGTFTAFQGQGVKIG